MSYWTDEEFRDRILALLIRDRKFLRKLSGKLVAKDFESKDKNDADGWAREWVGKQALDYWSEYRQPIGGLLRTFALDYFRENRKETGKSRRETLLSLIEKLQDPELGVAVEAIQDKILKYKERQVLRRAVEEMVGQQENGGLQVKQFREIVARVMNQVDFDDRITNYGETLDRRISRRELGKKDKYPKLCIEEFDSRHRTFPRGQVGLVLAAYKVGKSIFMAHLAQAHALQGFTTVLFTLEDPESLVEDRLDASLCGLKFSELPKEDMELRKRFRESWDAMRAKIFLVDGTGGGWTVQRMVETVDNLRNKGESPDVILIDYDEQVDAVGKYTGESALRMKSQEIWLDTVRWAARDDVWIWMGAQATIKKDTRVVLTGEDTAEDKSKVRKVGLGLGIGMGTPACTKAFKTNARWLQVMAHRFGRSRIGWPIVGDFERGIFYDRERTARAQELVRENKEVAS